jgi:hypothetical protein
MGVTGLNIMKLTISTLFQLLLLVSCTNYEQPSIGVTEAVMEEADTSRPMVTTTFQGTTLPPIFEAAFVQGTKVLQGEMAYAFYKYDVGAIKIESGKIIAADPIVMRDASPFTEHFPTGSFPVHLAMAKAEKDERVAFSRIVFSENPIVHWEYALKEGQKPVSIKDTSIYCYGVDAGIGLFIDSVANYYFNQKKFSEWEDVFIGTDKLIRRGYMHAFEGHNLATFTTGYGDGCYATYIGFDKEGHPCQLLTDFGLVAWWRL